MIILNKLLSDIILLNSEKLYNNNLIEILYVQNQGAAFNLFEGSKIFLITFALVAICVILGYILKNINKISTIGLLFSSMLVSGIFANMHERMLLGFVRDYFSLKFIDFPVFNISDIYINISVFAIIFIIIKNKFYKNNENNC